MSKALLYFPVPLQNETSGIAKKCLGIMHAFKEQYETDVMSEFDGEVFFNQVKIRDYRTDRNKLRFYYYNDIIFGQFSVLNDHIKNNSYDVVYIRLHYFVTAGMLQMMKKLRRANKAVRIYIEIPTFPFEKELRSKLFRLRNRLNRLTIPHLKKYVTGVVTLSTHDIIWDVPTIRISNGFMPSLTEDKISRLLPEPANTEFHIAMIANFNDWHAADILVNSLKEYYSTAKEVTVKVHFIGKMIAKVIDLVSRQNLQEHVVFHNEMLPYEIAAFLNKIHVCVGTLGHHRKNIRLDSSLKNREYAFLGMPMVLKTPDLDFTETLFFVKYFSDDETLMDIDSVIRFYTNLRNSHPDYKNEIATYAKATLGWNMKLKEVLGTRKEKLR